MVVTKTSVVKTTAAGTAMPVHSIAGDAGTTGTVVTLRH